MRRPIILFLIIALSLVYSCYLPRREFIHDTETATYWLESPILFTSEMRTSPSRTTRIYDGDFYLKYYLENGRIYNTNWRLRYYLHNDKIYDRNYNLKYCIEGNRIYDRNGNLRYRIWDNRIYDKDYQLKFGLGR